MYLDAQFIRNPVQNRRVAFFRSVASFLNSPLGLWLLSSVLVIGGPWLYTQHRLSREHELEKQQRIQRLDLEVEARLSQFLESIAAKAKRPWTADLDVKDGVRLSSDWHELISPPRRNSSVLGVYPDFADTPIVGLIAELRQMEPNKSEQGALEMAAMSLAADPFADNPKSFLPTWNRISRPITLHRWTTFMPYISCASYTEMFCEGWKPEY